ncbi:MAG: carbohydrate binding domain-containing protein [Proteobacteria bacterium]|nr:carbohydrate binding domain-containing protein [Pseudomonadota bacterium]
MKIKHIMMINFFLIFLTMVVPVESNANLITNGDFENDYSFWTPSHIDGSGGHRDWGGVHGGFFLLNDGGSPESDPAISQTIYGLQVGKTYTVKWDQLYHYPDYPGDIGFGVFLNNQPENPIALNGSTALDIWQTFSTTFNAAGTSAVLYFAAELDQRTPGVFTRTDMGYGIDNVSVTMAPVPLPSALLLFAPGLAGLAAIRRRFTK